MKPLIGITMNPDIREGDRIGRIYSFYLEAVREAGCVPVSLFDGDDEAELLAHRLDGLLLSGGDDLDPAYYGQSDLGCRGVDSRRDALEFALTHAFLAIGKPLLGICRGMQVLAAATGGTLIQDIPSQLGIPHTYGQRHDIYVRPGTFLADFLPKQVEVNSTHHQSVDRLPPGFLLAAAAPDGVIEAMQAATGAPVYGVQFHPERLYQEDERLVELFRLLAR